jgi:hypothetical protein
MANFCSECGLPLAVGTDSNFCERHTKSAVSGAKPVDGTLATNIGKWMGRHPILTILLLVLFLGC